VVVFLFIVGFSTLTAIKISSFHTLLLFSLYPIILTMFFIDRYTMLFIAGLSVSVSLWLLGYYYLMPWYFLIYGVAAFVAYPYIHSPSIPMQSTINSQNIYLLHDREENGRNTLYVMYSMVIISLGETLIDWIVSGSTLALIKFPIHIVEGALSGTLAIITISLIETIKNKRSGSSSYKVH